MSEPNVSEPNVRRTRRGKQSSRQAMHELRAKPPAIDPCPPGPVGGQYKPLSPSDINQIVASAMRILSELGMGEAPDVLVKQAVSKGASVNHMGRLCFSRSMIEDVIDGACKSFVYYGRDSRHDFTVGGDRVYFGTGGAAVQTLDLDSSQYRPSTLRDLYDFTRLIDQLDNVSWFTRCCVATDVPNNFDLDINTAYALLKGTTKPVGTSFFIDKHVAPIVEMFDWALGGKGKFRERPFCKAHISPVISPLRYGEDAVLVASTLAETLAALIMINVFEPGYPMIFSNWPLVIDLRTGSFAGGGGEISLLNAASAQLSNHLGLPSGVACSMADAKAVDAQMGMEKALSAVATGLAGGNMVYESSGMTASLLGASFAAFVVDDEMLSHVYRLLRGVEVNEETLGFDAIKEAISGEGHFLGGDHTLAAMQRDHFYPRISDRLAPNAWQESGAQDMWQRANLRAREILDNHHPDYLSASVDQRIRQHFNILL